MTVQYNPRYAVTAAWGLSHFPANICFVFFQRAGSSVSIIGSDSFMFPTLAEAISALGGFPWPVAKHVLSEDWTIEFSEHSLHNTETVLRPSNPMRPIHLTQALLTRCDIDESERPWVKDGRNNQILIDSLADYRLPERGEVEGMDYGNTPVAGFEQYFVNAMETFALWEAEQLDSEWGAPLDYTVMNKAARVIPNGKIR